MAHIIEVTVQSTPATAGKPGKANVKPVKRFINADQIVEITPNAAYCGIKMTDGTTLRVAEKIGAFTGRIERGRK